MRKSLNQHSILVLRAQKELADNVQSAIEKFKQIQGIQVKVINSNLNMAAEQIELGLISIIFIETVMEKAEANFFLSCIQNCKKLPYIICSADNYAKIRHAIPNDNIYCQKGSFSSAFIFNCIRNLLTPANHKIDIRYIKSILLSVIDVIQKNTGLSLKPDPITEFKQKEQPEDFVAAVTFYGDGFLGSITARCSRGLVQKFAEKIFFTNEAQNDNTLIDVLGEISNQILGVARNSLKDFGYELRNSMQVVCSGNQFLYDVASNGRYYEIPFRLEEESFNITFCYNTYRTTVYELGISEQTEGINRFDIRFLQLLNESTKQILESNLQAKVERTGIDLQKSEPRQANSFHIFHTAGWQGELCLALEAPPETCQFIREKMYGPSENNEFDPSTTNDTLKELLNQIGGDFLNKSKNLSYSFQRIYQASFSEAGSMLYLLKTSGYLSRIDFTLEDRPIYLYLGLRSDSCSAYFDAWPYLQAAHAG